MNYKLIWTNKFKKEYKIMMKRGKNIDKLDKVITMLASGIVLPAEYDDHSLIGNWKGYRECHIEPNWILIYYKQDNILVLTLAHTGTHSDLF